MHEVLALLGGGDRKLLTFLKRMEQYLIDHEALQAVGFRFVGGA